MAITITAILAGIVTLFIRLPLQGYFDVARRADLTDEADLAVRRIARDVHGALPNSLRVSTVLGVTYLEFLAVRTGGRYREQPSGGAVACATGDDTLAVGLPDTCFRSLGPIPDLATIATGAAAGDFLVLYNLGPGMIGADAYAGGSVTGGNKSRILARSAPGGNEDQINFESLAFPLASPSKRFFVVSGPVTYACAPAAGGGTLTRFAGYPISAAQLTPPPVAPALLANGVTGCAIAYEASAAATRSGVVTINLTLTRIDPIGNAESVNLYAQAHVVNSP